MKQQPKTMECKICGKVVTVDKKRGNIGNVCSSCRQRYRQIKMKQKAIQYKGNKCQRCGYDNNPDALEFHHLNPSTKTFTLSSSFNKSWNVLKNELDKCLLLCANCHREIHAEQQHRHTIEEYEQWITPMQIQNQKQLQKEQCIQTLRYPNYNFRKLVIDTCHIDFASYGWAKQLSYFFCISSAATVRWVKKNLPVFYKNNCYHEKDIDDIDISNILTLYKKYHHINTIAQLLQIDVGRISQILHQNGITPISNGKTIHMLDINTKQKLHTFTSIAEAGIFCMDNIKSLHNKGTAIRSIKEKISRCINHHQKTAYGYIWIAN